MGRGGESKPRDAQILHELSLTFGRATTPSLMQSRTTLRRGAGKAFLWPCAVRKGRRGKKRERMSSVDRGQGARGAEGRALAGKGWRQQCRVETPRGRTWSASR